MKLKKDWISLMSLVERMFHLGYSVMMNNHKRWEVFCNDSQLLNNLPEYEDEVRGNKSNFIHLETNLDCLYMLLTDFVDWYVENIKEVPTHYLTEKPINILELKIFEK